MELIKQFERCTLPREEWTHENHFVVALWYCVNFPLPEAVRKIREGIKAFNVASGGENTAVAGYHETITLFYVHTVAEFIITKGVNEVTSDILEIFLKQPFVSKGYIDRFYSKKILMSPEARASWYAPDMS